VLTEQYPSFNEILINMVRSHANFDLNIKHIAMEKHQIIGNWNELKGKIKQKFANLTDDDLMYQEGKEDELYGRLEKKIGKTKEQVRDFIGKL
jgi:uncharacterized protein YjbJ (UPF0337 family)